MPIIETVLFSICWHHEPSAAIQVHLPLPTYTVTHTPSVKLHRRWSHYLGSLAVLLLVHVELLEPTAAEAIKLLSLLALLAALGAPATTAGNEAP